MHNQIRIKAGLIKHKALLSSGLNTLGILVIAAALGLGSALAQTAAAGEAEFTIGTRLANMLRASRSVISANQPLINNPGVGDKSFTSQKVINDAESNYVKRVGAPLLAYA